MRMLGAEDPVPGGVVRILVAGASGAGKSTLARSLAQVLGLDYFEVDALYHGPHWTPRAEFVADVERLSAGHQWVTEWQYPETRPLLADRAQLMVWLDLPRALVVAQVTRRTLARRIHRSELWNGNLEPPLHRFITDRDHVIRWAWRTHAGIAGQVLECAGERPHLIVVRLRSRSEVRRWLAGPVRTYARRSRAIG
jgi:adenylate kinase family enzyme